jgi:hypothetical protein
MNLTRRLLFKVFTVITLTITLTACHHVTVNAINNSSKPLKLTVVAQRENKDPQKLSDGDTVLSGGSFSKRYAEGFPDGTEVFATFYGLNKGVCDGVSKRLYQDETLSLPVDDTICGSSPFVVNTVADFENMINRKAGTCAAIPFPTRAFTVPSLVNTELGALYLREDSTGSAQFIKTIGNSAEGLNSAISANELFNDAAGLPAGTDSLIITVDSNTFAKLQGSYNQVFNFNLDFNKSSQYKIQFNYQNIDCYHTTNDWYSIQRRLRRTQDGLQTLTDAAKLSQTGRLWYMEGAFIVRNMTRTVDRLEKVAVSGEGGATTSVGKVGVKFEWKKDDSSSSNQQMSGAVIAAIYQKIEPFSIEPGASDSQLQQQLRTQPIGAITPTEADRVSDKKVEFLQAPSNPQ